MIRSLPLLVILCLALLSGCAHQNKPQTSTPPVSLEDWSKRQNQIMAIRDWQASGKLGIKVPNDGGSASLQWQQNSSDYQIDLAGPLGMGKMTITGTRDAVTLSQSNRPPQTATTAEELIVKNTGWKIPVAQLTYWIRGLPAPVATVTRYAFNDQGGLGELEQAGWKITYGEYLQTSKDIPMPGRITAEFKDVRLILVLREWQF